MRDILYNLGNNDIECLNGDFRIIEQSGQQNADIIIAKSCVDIMRPQFGIGFFETYPHMREDRLRNVLNEAKRQIYDDGAASVQISHRTTNKGEYTIIPRVKYRGE